jgi:endonuclease/exonuclease/phosphatase family metal-dependent hydrolase
VIIKLLSYNIRFGGTGREKQLAAVIRQIAPDIVILQEATAPRVVEQLAAATEMPIWAAQVGYSLAFISRLEISHHEWHLPPGARRAFLELVPAGIDCRIFGLHLSAVHSNWTEQRRVRELRALLKTIEQHQNGFHVLVGDFNTLAPGEQLDITQLPMRLQALIWLSGRTIRWETIQIMLDAQYVDGYRLLHPHDKGYTMPTWAPHVRLDYIFVPAPAANRLQSCQVINNGAAAQASDHFPLLAQLEVDTVA